MKERRTPLLPIGAFVAGVLLLLLLRGRERAPWDAPPADRPPVPVPFAPPDPPAPGPAAISAAPSAPEDGSTAAVPPPEAPLSPADPAEPGVVMPEGGENPLRPAEVRAVPGGPAPIPAPGRAPPIPLSKFVESGLGAIRGAVEVVPARAPVVEAGVPVALSGRVVETGTGAPVAGASVVLRSAFYERSIWYDHSLVEVARAVTDPDGEYRIERLNVDPVHFGKGGLVYLSVASPDHAPLLAVPLADVTPGSSNRLADLVLTRERYAIRGRVLDQWEGKPVVGGRVVATGEILPIQYPKDQREAIFLSAPQAVTDEEGRFVLLNVGPGRQMLSVHGGNDCIGYEPVDVPIEGEVLLRTRWIRGRIAGTVLDDRDRPIPLVRVDGGENTTHTFGDGTFVLENFRGDPIAVHLAHTDYRPKTVEAVPEGTEGLLLRLESRWPELRFRVVRHEDGKPIATVFVRLKTGAGQAVPMPASPFYVAESGVHAVRVPEGSAVAVVGSGGRTPAEVDLAGARDGDVIEVILRPE